MEKPTTTNYVQFENLEVQTKQLGRWINSCRFWDHFAAAPHLFERNVSPFSFLIGWIMLHQGIFEYILNMTTGVTTDLKISQPPKR